MNKNHPVMMAEFAFSFIETVQMHAFFTLYIVDSTVYQVNRKFRDEIFTAFRLSSSTTSLESSPFIAFPLSHLPPVPLGHSMTLTLSTVLL
jgi:Trk-type K+ transport system membrane component